MNVARLLPPWHVRPVPPLPGPLVTPVLVAPVPPTVLAKMPHHLYVCRTCEVGWSTPGAACWHCGELGE